MTGSWLVYSRRVPRPRARLVCFPYAGGSSTPYHGWDVGDDVEVQALVPPGRSARLREAPIREQAALVDAIEGVLGPLDGPLVLYGHSMGALVAWELAHRLVAAGREIAGLVVAGRGAPDTPRYVAPLGGLGDRELVQGLARVYGADTRAFADPELAEIVLPGVRADLVMHEGWRVVPRPPLGVPVLAIGGMADDSAPRAAIEGWRAFTTGPFESAFLAAGHFFLESHRAEVVARVRAWLAGRLPGGPGPR